MEDLMIPLTVIAVAAILSWRRYQDRRMIHAERIAAIEKGIEPPDYPEFRPKDFQMRPRQGRILLLSGLIWLAVGLGALIAGSIILADPVVRAMPDAPPPTAYWGGLIPLFVGIAHLIVYFKEKGEK